MTAAAGIPESPSHVAPAAAVSSTQEANLTPMQKAWDLAGTRGHQFEIRPYRAVYLLPLFTTSNVNSTPSSPTRQSTEVDGIRATEAKFQLSFKTKAATDLSGDNGDLWLAYTQSSRWQVYSENLAPIPRDRLRTGSDFRVADQSTYRRWTCATSALASTTNPTAGAANYRVAGTG